jgi:hypothetical protein
MSFYRYQILVSIIYLGSRTRTPPLSTFPPNQLYEEFSLCLEKGKCWGRLHGWGNLQGMKCYEKSFLENNITKDWICVLVCVCMCVWRKGEGIERDWRNPILGPCLRNLRELHCLRTERIFWSFHFLKTGSCKQCQEKRIRSKVKIEDTIVISQNEISQHFSCIYKT